jgi:hypothetical protein
MPTSSLAPAAALRLQLSAPKSANDPRARLHAESRIARKRYDAESASLVSIRGPRDRAAVTANRRATFHFGTTVRRDVRCDELPPGRGMSIRLGTYAKSVLTRPGEFATASPALTFQRLRDFVSRCESLVNGGGRLVGAFHVRGNIHLNRLNAIGGLSMTLRCCSWRLHPALAI